MPRAKFAESARTYMHAVDLVAGDFNGDRRIDLAYIDGWTQCDSCRNSSSSFLVRLPDGKPSSLPFGRH